MNNISIDRMIINKLNTEIGSLKGRVIEVETFNEILVEQNKQLRAQLQEVESGEGTEEDSVKEGE